MIIIKNGKKYQNVADMQFLVKIKSILFSKNKKIKLLNKIKRMLR